MAIQSLKDGGPDDVPAEALKVGIVTSTEALYRLFATTWEEEEVEGTGRRDSSSIQTTDKTTRTRKALKKIQDPDFHK